MHIKFVKILLLAIVLLYNLILFASNSGKIAGRVSDESSDEPLPGVNIVLLKTSLGAASDSKGQFFITNIPPGTYHLLVSMIGYKTVKMNEVRVIADLTTRLDFKLTPEILKGEMVTIVAEQPLIQKDITAKMAIISGESIRDQMPVTTLTDVLKSQAGVVEDGRGQIHIRGGRADEIAFYIDGVQVENVLNGEIPAAIDINAIQELSVLTGGFNAEYGEVMSGVVNITTREGEPDFQFRLQYESAMLNSSPFRQADWLLKSDLANDLKPAEKEWYRDAVKDGNRNSAFRPFNVFNSKYNSRIPVKLPGRLSSFMSGKVPYLSNLFFFLSGTYLNENSYLPWGFRLERQVLGKLTYTPISGIKLNLIYENQAESTQNYSHLYKYFPYFNAQGRGEQSIHRIVMNRFGFSMTQTLNPATFYSLHFNYLSQNQRREIEARTVVFDSQTGAFLSSDYLQRAFVFGRESDFWYGDDRDWFRNHCRTYSTKFHITSQMNPNHQVKFGFDLRQHQIFQHRIQRPWAASFYHRIEFYDRKPVEGAAFIQDKMEYDFMVLNLGLRLDYVHNNDMFWQDPGNIQYIDGNNQFQFVPQIKVPRSVQISPRIGLAHPVTDKLVFHFAYGHFFQNPPYSILFLNDTFLPNLKESDPILGNPGLKPQTTIAFEVGAKYQLSPDIALELTGYFRDMRNLITTQYYARAPYDYTIFVNQDYGRVKGFDFTLVKRAGRFFAGNLNYTLMMAKGSGHDPFTGYYYREEDAHLRPKREIFLDFDRTHDFSVNLDFRLPTDFGPEFIRTKPLGGIGLNALFSFASGLPYTPLDYSEASFNVEPYSARMGNSKSLDLRLDKQLKLCGIGQVIYLKIENLFNWKNPRIVWEATGDPWNGGPEDYNTKDCQADPTHIGPPRQIRLGYYLKL